MSCFVPLASTSTGQPWTVDFPWCEIPLDFLWRETSADVNVQNSVSADVILPFQCEFVLHSFQHVGSAISWKVKFVVTRTCYIHIIPRSSGSWWNLLTHWVKSSCETSWRSWWRKGNWTSMVLAAWAQVLPWMGGFLRVSTGFWLKILMLKCFEWFWQVKPVGRCLPPVPTSLGHCIWWDSKRFMKQPLVSEATHWSRMGLIERKTSMRPPWLEVIFLLLLFEGWGLWWSRFRIHILLLSPRCKRLQLTMNAMLPFGSPALEGSE